ncbi:uncharacterized protein METZ01_LOCUS144591 [marine metagenome]|uniref:Nudix hydrolase domain-containing protein n=1 Tax=marine metagenome TaxID=408172 RepID=A0A381ZSG4_9ZZZZ
MDSGIKFCQYCGGPLRESLIASVSRPVCSSCGRITYLDPKVAAVTLVYSDHKLLLVKRAIEPAYGRWSFPSGYVDRGEAVESAAAREVLEEANLHVEITGLQGIYSGDSPVVLVAFRARVTDGIATPGDEVTDIGWFELDNIPELPFPHDEKIIRDFISQFGN